MTVFSDLQVRHITEDGLIGKIGKDNYLEHQSLNFYLQVECMLSRYIPIYTYR